MSTAPVTPPSRAPHHAEPLAVVGIGASAGGLKALQRFMEAVPADSGMAYVVIMHLDPERRSRIGEILQDRTSLPVTQVTRATPVRANHVYVIPPGQDLEMVDATIRVLPRGDSPQHSPIDLFFRTLAQAYGSDAVGVVLSGSGSDGTAGVRHIREHGGVTVAQLPAEAGYDAMPAAAIATGQIDLVLPAAEIPAELLRLRRMPSPLPAGAPAEETETQLGRIFAALRGRTGQDFRLYRRATVLRRLERRLRFNGAATLEAYLPLLQESDTEARALVRDLLISVSGFFRDPEAFRALAKLVPSLFEGKGPDDAVRVWVAGCATGEEAYSIAILLAEHAATLPAPPAVQMFATDLDEKGYAWGRDALYPASVVAELPPERLGRFFVPEAGGYRVRKSLREGVLFAVHNVLQDPPFARMDLISCRNLLIYLQPEAQEQVIGTFHYALRPGGILFLGTAETAGESPRFAPAARKQRIYRRDGTAPRLPARTSAADPVRHLAAMVPGAVADAHRPAGFSYGALHLRLLEAYAPPSLVVDEQLQVVHLSGGAGDYLHVGEGEPSRSVIDLTRGALRMELRAALYQAFEKGMPTVRRVHPDDPGGPRLRLRVTPSLNGEQAGRFALVVLDPHAEAGVSTDPDANVPEDAANGDIRAELRLAREQLESASAARDQTVAQLQSANDELHSINEEQKAAAEELETSREEIQSINEELTTINQEHQNTIDELRRTNADLRNLIESTEIGTIFLDREMRIRRYTPAVEALFHFVPTDAGRPLAHITHRLDYPGLVDDARRVLASQGRIECEARSDTGTWFVVRINPYRALDDAIDGVVLTFFDITAQKRVEEALRQATSVAEQANLAKDTFLATLSHEFRTPLNGMLGYADILYLDGPLTPGQERKIARIRAGGWHLASMIDEILAFAKLDAGEERVRSAPEDARRIATEAHALVHSVADGKGLSFVLDVPDEAVMLRTDAGKATQVLVNLCGNAIKYTGKGEVRLAVRAEGERVVFEVSDTGMGIAPEHQVRIFDRFWQ
ncbi:MAG TPA: chemotaxis protein CheB, partial [Longimicrobium sp.]|nr:chemotaxis protein CheB [Longimicrobium sp.]